MAFNAAVRKHGRGIFSLALYLLRDHPEAEDVTQEVLIRLWRRGSEVDPGRLGPWLLRVTRNACIDLIRRRRSPLVPLPEDGSDLGAEPAATSPGPEMLAGAAQLGRHITVALSQLSEPQRSIVILREVHGLPYQEIADVLELPVGTVRVNLHRGRRRLRHELREVVDHVAVG